ncbi:Tyrosine recombinase XerA [Candidatus Burarchaeum australiense]|nr:Tyrosine recombinase XerA [Candidatus Burarchaeum australiense]
MRVSDGRSPKRFFENERNWPGVGPENRKLLEDFDHEKAAQGASEGTRYMYLFCLTKLARHFNGKPFRNLSKSDLIDFFERWKDYKSPSLKISVKSFYKWLSNGVYPEQVAWLKTHGFQKRKLPEDILTQEEVKKLADSSLNPRDRALIMLLYESGARAGELIGLNLKDLAFDEFGVVVMLDGKTGMRRVRLIDCVPDLKTWLNNHPQGKNPNAPLFPELRGKFNRLGNHATLANILKAAKRRSGSQKRIYPHLFRHSRATHLAKEFTEQELKIIFGWSGSSRMPATYVHLSGADLDRKMLEKRGLVETLNSNGKTTLNPVMCSNCHCENSSTARFCAQCGIAFFLKDAMEAEAKKKDAVKLFDAILQDEELKQAITKKLLAGSA